MLAGIKIEFVVVQEGAPSMSLFFCSCVCAASRYPDEESVIILMRDGSI
jgi:hypothetical protein